MLSVNGLTEEQLLFRNLKDSGCDDDSIRQFLKLKKEGREKELMRLLSAHRADLLDQVHTSQHQIDCLDYLIYTMERRKGRKS